MTEKNINEKFSSQGTHKKGDNIKSPPSGMESKKKEPKHGKRNTQAKNKIKTS